MNRNWQIFSWKFKKYYEKYKVFAITTKKYQVFYKNLRKIPNLSRKSRKNTKFLHKLRKNYTKMKIFHNLRDFLQIFFLKSTFQKKYEQLQWCWNSNAFGKYSQTVCFDIYLFCLNYFHWPGKYLSSIK